MSGNESMADEVGSNALIIGCAQQLSIDSSTWRLSEFQPLNPNTACSVVLVSTDTNRRAGFHHATPLGTTVIRGAHRLAFLSPTVSFPVKWTPPK